MDHIKPAIISRDFNEIKYKVDIVDDLVSWVHLDVMDGEFAPQLTWHTPDDLVELPGKVKLEIHLMVNDPDDILRLWFNAADRVLIHVESTKNIESIIEAMEPHSTKIGLSVLTNTPFEDIKPYLDKVDFIQLMTIDEIGFHGKPFSDKALERIKHLRELWPNGTIQVDGGINLTTGKQALDAGADILVVGSGIWQAENHKEALKTFLNLKK